MPELSILLPIYNFDSVKLVHDLHEQCQATGNLAYEIICLDDGSEQSYREKHRNLSSLSNVVYEELETNIGRSKIRNVLCEKANFNNLLFLDCDSQLPKKDFIASYLSELGSYEVIYGGRSYETNPPTDPVEYFRWYYGVERESINAEIRLKSPYKTLMTNNFLVKKELLMRIPFNESITGYGHEDTTFSQDLRLKNVKIKHINNPVDHIGLETHVEFLKKTKEGIFNLAGLINNNQANMDIKLYKTYRAVKKIKLLGVVGEYLKKHETKYQDNLVSKSPNLRNFDLLKLSWLIHAMK